jgi:twitching motility protein PilT
MGWTGRPRINTGTCARKPQPPAVIFHALLTEGGPSDWSWRKPRSESALASLFLFVVHNDDKSIINQREVGTDTASFARALRRVLRQDPDVILIGEIRDAESAQMALSAAETGHLVLSTLHTVDATETINRLIDLFPPHERNQVRTMIAGTLKGIVGQRLIRTKSGFRAAVCEVMVTTGRIRDFIMDPAQTGQIEQAISEGEYYGMQTFDQALLKLVEEDRVDYEEAIRISSRPQDFKLMVYSLGQGQA